MKTDFVLPTILFLFLLFICNSMQSENKDVSEFVPESTKSKLILATADNQIDSSLIGVWVNLQCIARLNETQSITKSLEGYNFYVSISITKNNQCEGKINGEMESDPIYLNGNKFNIGDEIFEIKKVEGNIINISSKTQSYNFRKLGNNNYINSYDGEYYLYSYLLLGNYEMKDLTSNKFYYISFQEANKVNGFSEYEYFYPSSYLNHDIILFRKKDNTQLSFIFKKTLNGFLFHEVDNFDWNDEPLIKTGKTYSLKKNLKQKP